MENTPAWSKSDLATKVIQFLLFAGGLVAALIWLPRLVLWSVYAWAWASGGGNEFGNGLFFAAFAAPFVTFCFYAWVVWRSWRAERLLIWGVIAHLHLLYWVPRGPGHPEGLGLFFYSVMVLGLLLYSAYTCLVWRRTSPALADLVLSYAGKILIVLMLLGSLIRLFRELSL